jgi:hypothetical protein
LTGQTYEIRLLKIDGSTAMIHLTVCATVQEAEARMSAIGDVLYDRYEIWGGGLKVASGSNPKEAPL